MDEFVLAAIMMSPVMLVAGYLVLKIYKDFKDFERKLEEDDFDQDIF
jgi:hypothetical protein